MFCLHLSYQNLVLAIISKLCTLTVTSTGRVVDMSLQIGTDSSVSNMDHQGASFVVKVDLAAWAPLCKVCVCVFVPSNMCDM